MVVLWAYDERGCTIDYARNFTCVPSSARHSAHVMQILGAPNAMCNITSHPTHKVHLQPSCRRRLSDIHYNHCTGSSFQHAGRPLDLAFTFQDTASHACSQFLVKLPATSTSGHTTATSRLGLQSSRTLTITWSSTAISER